MLLSRVLPVETETVSLKDCPGRVLGMELKAEQDIPPFDRSPYDGYAFIASDTSSASKEEPAVLRVIGKTAAGQMPEERVTPGTAVKILTGAPIPQGADAVCMYEETLFTEDTVTIFRSFRQGENVVYAGEDVRKGTVLAHRGDVIDPGIAGSLAAQGKTAPCLYRIPRIGLISTGSEVVEADKPQGEGKIRNSNRYMLEAALLREGLQPVFLGLAEDDIPSIEKLIRKGASDCDAVILTGGVSVGDYDLTPAAMEAAGCEMLFQRVDLKPGMACAYGMLKGKAVCALSGNPASALTNYYAITLPALKKLAGRRQFLPEEITVTLRNGFGKKSKATRILRGHLDLTRGDVGMTLSQEQGNAVLSSAIGCDVAAVIPAGSGKLEPGTRLKGFLL